MIRFDGKSLQSDAERQLHALISLTHTQQPGGEAAASWGANNRLDTNLCHRALRCGLGLQTHEIELLPGHSRGYEPQSRPLQYSNQISVSHRETGIYKRTARLTRAREVLVPNLPCVHYMKGAFYGFRGYIDVTVGREWSRSYPEHLLLQNPLKEVFWDLVVKLTH